MATILIVEDSPTQAEVARQILEDGGHQAEVVDSAEAALDCLDATPFDAVISDIQLPQMSGFELCATIRQHPACSRLPIILMSAQTRPTDILRAVELEADAYVMKPYEPETLLARVQATLTLPRPGPQPAARLEAPSLEQRPLMASPQRLLDYLLDLFEDLVATRRREAKGLAALEETQRRYNALLVDGRRPAP